MKLASILVPLLSTGIIAATTPAHAAVECKTYRGANVCISDYGTYSVYFSEGYRIEGQCSTGIRYTPGIPFPIMNEIHKAICKVQLDLGV